MTSTAIVDSGPLITAANRSDPAHLASLAALETPGLYLVIPILCVAEVVYFLSRYRLESRFLRGLEAFDVQSPAPQEWSRIADLVDPTGAGFGRFRGAPKDGRGTKNLSRGLAESRRSGRREVLVERGACREPCGALQGLPQPAAGPRSARGGAPKKRGRVAPNRGRLALFGGEVALFGGGVALFGGEVAPFGGGVALFRGSLPQFGGGPVPLGGSPAPLGRQVGISRFGTGGSPPGRSQPRGRTPSRDILPPDGRPPVRGC